MKRLAKAFLLGIVLVVLGGAAALWSATPAKTVPMAGASVMIALTSGHGSGVHIGNGYILTAAHVVEDEKEITVKTDDGRDFKPEVLWVNSRYDLALLKIAPDRIAARNLACGKVGVGAPVWSLGNPMGVRFVAFWGHVSGSIVEIGDWAEAYPTDLTIAPGMSGGPLIDARGNVVGIVVATTRGYPISIAVPSSTACRLMGRAA
jgi:S1-C subfamily serine protease